MPPDRILRVVLGLAGALGLAALVAHPRVKEWEKRLGISLLLSSGLPFLLLGYFFRWEEIDILSERVLLDLRPAFTFGLGWIGFVVGSHFSVRKLDRLPRQLGGAIVAQAAAPMLTVVLLCAPLLVVLDAVPVGVDIWRYLVVLAACAAASAPINVAALSSTYGETKAALIDEITGLDELAALLLLGLLSIFYRPESSWILPSSAWFLVAIGLGTTLGALTYVMIRGATSEAEEIAYLLGSVALAAGAAGYLVLSVPVICAIAGALLANLPMRDPEGLRALLVQVERPFYLLFLIVVGASWRPLAWQGWALALVFVLGRVSGKGLGIIWAKHVGPPELPSPSQMAEALLPQSPIAILVIVASASLLNREEFVHWTIHAVIVGGVMTEAVVKLASWWSARAERQRLSPALPVPSPSPAPTEAP